MDLGLDDEAIAALRQTFLETATHDTQAFLARVRARLVD